MQIEIKLDSECKEPKIIVITDKMSDEVNNIIKKISQETPQMIAGFKGDICEVLDYTKIVRFVAENGKVFAINNTDKYTLRLRLYELEEMLDKTYFVRISNSEIINLKKVISFDLSFAGTICVKLENDSFTYVSRRYVQKIKKVLGI